MKEVKFVFEKWNNNPNYQEGKRYHYGDCVIRAICKTTGLGWYEVYDMLCAKGRECGDFGDRIEVYPQVLAELGFQEFGCPRIKGKKAMNVQRFIEEHPQGTFILRLAHHATAIVDGICYDMWYPQTESVYRYWQLIKETRL